MGAASVQVPLLASAASGVASVASTGGAPVRGFAGVSQLRALQYERESPVKMPESVSCFSGVSPGDIGGDIYREATEEEEAEDEATSQKVLENVPTAMSIVSMARYICAFPNANQAIAL